ncbi:MAG: hypothetical protein NTU98_10095 [Bacteroidetes bacterium]|nr:hypothetical protein [Bacteroidota bacterium]
MKTIAKTLLATILLMVSFSAFSFAGNGAANISTGTIIYQVTVHVSNDIPMIGNYYYVAVMDGQGKLVAPVQMYNSGKMTYTFLEAGPVKGTRVATLIPVPNAENPDAHFIVPPDVKTGVFAPGSIYNFNLWPTTTRTR